MIREIFGIFFRALPEKCPYAPPPRAPPKGVSQLSLDDVDAAWKGVTNGQMGLKSGHKKKEEGERVEMVQKPGTPVQ